MKHKAVRPHAGSSFFTAITAVAIVFSAFSASALLSDDNSLVEGAKLCTRYLPRHERQYGIPVHLLAAIASTESGRYHKALGLNLPWPWTINVEGKGYFFDTKQEAIATVQKLQARGIESIDVGCMQVNLHHHPYAFANLDQAFDPAYNVAYAAQFLKQNFEEEGSWRKATADYHSHTPFYGEQYARLVFGAWTRIINKVADARAGRPILNTYASKTPTIRYHDRAAADAADVIMRSRRLHYRAPHMYQISVSHDTARDTTRENGVMVVRGTHDASLVQEQARLDDQFVMQPVQSLQVPVHKESVAAAETVAADTDKNAQVVKIQGGRVISAKGQFEPESHVIHVDSPSPQTSATKTNDSVFVFNN